MPSVEIPYELEILANAKQYQKWVFSEIGPYLGNRILELGSGLGSLSQWLPSRELLVLTEADNHLFEFLKRRFSDHSAQVLQIDLDHPFSEQVRHLDIDTLVSFNVMEHIEDDRAGFREQVKVLLESKAPGEKRIIAFVPAHRFAYGSFDRSFKHFRRYEACDLKNIFSEINPAIKLKTFYFNLLSLPGWIFAGRFLKQTRFSPTQIKILEALIPLWKPVDWFLHRVVKIPLGQSVVLVAEISKDCSAEEDDETLGRN